MSGITWTKAEDDWILQNHDNYKNRKELFSAFCQIFKGRGLEGFYTRCTKTLKIKGVGMRRTQYGNKQREELPIGTERTAFVTGNYKTIYVKVMLTGCNKRTSGYSEPYWKVKQKKIYEEAYGETPEGSIVVFLDRNPENFNINNLYCVDRKILAVMNKNKWFTENRDNTLTAIKWCELFYALKNREG